jgi:hypothetical protein
MKTVFQALFIGEKDDQKNLSNNISTGIDDFKCQHRECANSGR